jgi:hypothetical protein
MKSAIENLVTADKSVKAKFWGSRHSHQQYNESPGSI